MYLKLIIATTCFCFRPTLSLPLVPRLPLLEVLIHKIKYFWHRTIIAPLWSLASIKLSKDENNSDVVFKDCFMTWSNLFTTHLIIHLMGWSCWYILRRSCLICLKNFSWYFKFLFLDFSIFFFVPSAVEPSSHRTKEPRCHRGQRIRILLQGKWVSYLFFLVVFEGSFYDHIESLETFPVIFIDPCLSMLDGCFIMVSFASDTASLKMFSVAKF